MRSVACLLATLCIATSTVCAAAQSGQQPNTSDKQKVSRQGTQNPEAYALYLKGRSYFDKQTLSDLKTAASYFNQAIAKDPKYALAYAALARTYAVLPDYGDSPVGDIPKSIALARKAIELDPTLASPLWAAP
jgi:tetratricopeptide (TPR) repeat protein